MTNNRINHRPAREVLWDFLWAIELNDVYIGIGGDRDNTAREVPKHRGS